MNSNRFPGKVLYMLNNSPLLKYLLGSIDRCKSIDKVIVATSRDIKDEPIVGFCNEHNIECYRGALNNVADRIREVITTFKLDSFVRISADSPLLDYRIIDSAVNVFLSENYSMVTNIFPRSYPKGQSVEVVNSKMFLDNYPRFADEDDFEHVTKYFYRHHNQFDIHNLAADKDYSDISLAVDTPEDMNTIKRIIFKMKRPHWEYLLDEIIEMYRA